MANSVPPVATPSPHAASAELSNTAATCSVIPYAPIGMPPEIALPTTNTSGCRPHRSVSPPGPATRVWVSSITRSVPASAVSLRRPAWNPSSGWMTPVLVIAASVNTHATSSRASPFSTASRSLYGTIRTWRVESRSMPRPSGATVPPSTVASNSSAWPWYLPSNITTPSRPVAARAIRSASVLAGVADNVNCHNGIPNRSASRPATSAASRVGSRNCGPVAVRSATARAVASTP